MENSKNKEETKMSEVLNVEEIFGSKVFTLGKMRERLPKSVYKEVKKIIRERCHPLYPLVPASDRNHRREARCIRNPSR